MSIQSEIDRINQAKTDLAAAIESKGVTVPPNTTINVYPGLVQQIEQGAGLPTGGTPGQMLYQGESGAEWGIPPYLESMPQLDYAQMKSLHTLGITDLNDVTEPGSYIGMSADTGYPTIQNFPQHIAYQILVMNVYLFTGPDGSSYANYNMIVQEAFLFADLVEGFTNKQYRFGYRLKTSEDPYAFGPWTPGSNSVLTYFIPNGGLTSTNVQGAIEEVNEKIPAKPIYRTVTLTAAGWSSNTQTVTVQGVLADETAQLIQPMPAVASQNAYITAGVICSGQAANSLTFTCSTVPTDDITLYIVLTEVSA